MITIIAMTLSLSQRRKDEELCTFFYSSSYIQDKQILIERMKLYSIYKALHKLL